MINIQELEKLGFELCDKVPTSRFAGYNAIVLSDVSFVISGLREIIARTKSGASMKEVKSSLANITIKLTNKYAIVKSKKRNSKIVDFYNFWRSQSNDINSFDDLQLLHDKVEAVLAFFKANGGQDR